MRRFFEKNPPPAPTEKTALKMIHKKIHEAMDLFDSGKDYMPALLEVDSMILDLCEIKGVSSRTDHYASVLPSHPAIREKLGLEP